MTIQTLSRFVLTLSTVAVALFIISYSNPALAQSSVLREIRINGVQRIEPSTVTTYLGVNVGDNISKQTLNQGLKNLYATGLFADVRMREENGILLVDVAENPIINEIAFEGNSGISDDE
jgi:outer membrane protein insertion porin family